jgi:hypothetical protein
MTDLIETTSADRTTEYKSIVTTNFYEAVVEVAKSASYGWIVDPDRDPFYNFVIFEVHLIRNADTIAAAKAHFEASIEGRDVMTTQKRVENMNKARETRMKNLAAKKANKGDGDEGEVQ